MTDYFWFGGAPGARKPDVYLEDPSSGARLANTSVTIRDAETGNVLSDFLDAIGQPAAQVASDSAGYLTFAATVSHVFVDAGAGTWSFYSDAAVESAIAALPKLDAIAASAAASAYSASLARAAAEAAANNQITDGSVTATKLADGAVVAGKLAVDSVLAANIRAGEVGSGHLAPNSVVAGKLAVDSVLAANIKAGEITAAQMKPGTITAASGVVGSVDASKVTTGTMDGARIAAGTITPDRLSAALRMTQLGGGVATSRATTTWGILTSGPVPFFIAPPSGTVRIDLNTSLSGSTATVSALADVQTRPGTIEGQGTDVYTTTGMIAATGTVTQRLNGVRLVTGLTPGQSYYCRVVLSSGTDTVSVSVGFSTIIITPSP